MAGKTKKKRVSVVEKEKTIPLTAFVATLMLLASSVTLAVKAEETEEM